MRSEGRRIWSIKIGCATSSINTSSFTLLMILRTFLTPLILIWQLTHYDTHSLEAVPHSSSSQVIGSSHLSIFILFSHDESLCFVLLLIFFLIYHLIRHAVLKRNFLEFSSDSLMSNRLLISEMLLSRSGFPSCIRRLSCLRERTISLRIHSQLSFLQQNLKLDNLDYSIRICHQISSRSRPL